ncbi:MAG: arginine deiminase family protein [Candidatus Korarchaeum sp.]|nr:arginine deiminase family protein [Candidatus Korarchaeum sp.]MDW8035137.1 arginine deiminase family protein [Candidatus Korarchaeum sp.]
MRASQPAEWDRARVVLLCQPHVETLFAILETNSANFLYPFDLKKAIEEHRNYRRKLEEFGAKVYDLREMLVQKCVHEVSEENLRRLREFALKSVRYAFQGISEEDRSFLFSNLRRTIETLSPEVLADIIILRPVVNISYNPKALDPTTRFLSSYCLEPANNLYFMRDGMLTTKEGVVIGNFTLDVRKVENDIVELALSQIGVKPIYRVREPGHAEGGDFMPAGDFVLQGVGLLTDEEGARQMLESGVYGNVEVGLVRDPNPGMEEMHLDTYFNFLGRDLALLSEDRMVEGREPTVEVFEPVTEDRVRYLRKGKLSLKNYLVEKGFEIFPITLEEQRNFAPNFLLLEDRRLIGVAQAGESFAERLKQWNVKAELLDFSALTGGYGGPHCMSQVIVRE